MTKELDIDLSGMIDLHVHAAPDVRPRLFDDIDLARHAAQAGLQAILIKSHVLPTADRAVIAQKVVPGVRVFGGVALNRALGGLNPAAVEVAIRLGAKQVWMPTSSAAHHIAYDRCMGRSAEPSPGLSVLDADGRLLPQVHDILELVAKANIALGTGHLSPAEVRAVVVAAHEHRLKRIVVTHPELMLSSIPLDLQRDLALPGVWFERCYVAVLYHEPVPLELIAANIRALGVESTILSTDLGLAGLPTPVEGLRACLAGLLRLGFSWADLVRMTRDNPAELVGI